MKATAALLKRWNAQYIDELKAAMAVNEKKNLILGTKDEIDTLTAYIDNNFHNAMREMNKLCLMKEAGKCVKEELKKC